MFSPAWIALCAILAITPSAIFTYIAARCRSPFFIYYHIGLSTFCTAAVWWAIDYWVVSFPTLMRVYSGELIAWVDRDAMIADPYHHPMRVAITLIVTGLAAAGSLLYVELLKRKPEFGENTNISIPSFLSVCVTFWCIAVAFSWVVILPFTNSLIE